MTNPTMKDLQNEATWLEWRDQIPTPHKVTELVTTEDSRREFLEGARLLRLDKKRRYDGTIIGPTPIQLAIADMLAAGHKVNAVWEPRRTTKTTSIQAVLLGRCALREDYLVGWTLATTGAKAGERFKKDISAPIIRLYPDKRDREEFVKVELSKGSEGLVFPNGSYFNVYAPNADGFTSNAFDTAWVDEGGKATPEMGDDLTTAIRPTLHTRADAQLIISGTAPKYREGNLLWDALNDPAAGVIAHAAPDETDTDGLETWEQVEPLVLAAHPGIGWSTPLSAIEDDWNSPPMRKGFFAEILGIAGAEGSNTALIPTPLWTAAAVPLSEAAPAAVSSLCLFVHPDGDFASLVQAWAGADGRTHIALVHHQAGQKNLARNVLAIARKLGRPITFDSASAATANVLTELRAARPAPQERPMLSRDVRKAAVLFTSAIREDKLRHHDQQEMNSAAEIAVKRAWSSGGGWSFGRPKRRDDADITPIEAAALAVYALQTEKPTGTVPSIVFA